MYIFVAGAMVGFCAFGFGAGGGSTEEDGVVDEEEGDGDDDDCFAWNFASFAAFFASFSGFIFSLCVGGSVVGETRRGG